MPIETLKWVGGTTGRLELIDQRRLPGRLEKLSCQTPVQLFEAIRTLAVRGAPAIGVSAAYGVCLAVGVLADTAPAAEAMETVGKTCDYLASSRPTAVNLSWALQRMHGTAKTLLSKDPSLTIGALKRVLLDEADAMCAQDRRACEAIGQNGAHLIPDGGAVLTHCNAGALATAGIGTALAPMYVAYRQGRRFCVYADETRPLLQGARLTAWELTQAGIETVLICDSMAATLMQQGRIGAVITGADRIAANGDSANKVGTLGLSILARHYGIPFYIAAPLSTFDLSIADGRGIPIEERSGDEICSLNGLLAAPETVGVYNPAFDITPAGHITAIITERGLIYSPGRENIASAMGGV
ncbi:MAG: S-methyl-5-thioribose-1-phosphate isomerase [Planctomycetales bacterium]|nr:S-methyl-5-thioribose-1-phosphate isomerase [Planctomycetales bacterium]